MRFVSFRRPGGEARVGLLRPDGGVVDLQQSNPQLPTSLRALIASGPDVLSLAENTAKRPDAILVREPDLVAPVPDAPKVICIGLNYRDHAIETKAQIPKEPVV